MHDITRCIIYGMDIFVFKGANQEEGVIRLEEYYIFNQMSSLKRIRDPFAPLITILALPLISEMYFFRELESLGWFKVDLIFIHYVSENWFLLQKLQKLIECDWLM